MIPRSAVLPKKKEESLMAKLSKTSIQLSPETLEWLDRWPGMTRSEAIRLALKRTLYLHSLMRHIHDLVDKYEPILGPALKDFDCENYSTVVRLLPTLVGGYIEEAEKNGRDDWREQFTGKDLDLTDLYKKIEEMPPVERIYLLDCMVSRRGWAEEDAAGIES
jgi:hypothetical protein